jgi:hypothetical protein
MQDSRARLAGLARQSESGLASRARRARRALGRLADFFSIQLESPCLAVLWFPPLGWPVLIKLDSEHGSSGAMLFCHHMAPSPVGSEKNEHGRIAFGSMLP